MNDLAKQTSQEKTMFVLVDKDGSITQRNFGVTASMIPANIFYAWFDTLSKSLRLVYIPKETGKPLVEGDAVWVHPEFDPKVVERMDRTLGKKWGNQVYKAAFECNKARAQNLLDEDARKTRERNNVMNGSLFQSALARFSVFADETAVQLLRQPVPRSVMWADEI